MDFRILLPIVTYPDPTPVEALASAIELAATLGAQVTAVIHDLDVPPAGNPVAEFLVSFEAMSKAAESLSHSNGLEVREHLQHFCVRSGVPLVVETFKAERPAGERFAVRARTFDLTILGCDSDSPDHALLEQDVLFGSGGPVLIVPKGVYSRKLEVVTIAWDGGRAAARAARDALPLLARAGRVEVLTCTEDKPIAAGSTDALIELLSAHGIDAKHVPFSLNGSSIGVALQSAAKEREATMLVMGAYGHNRFREFVLGGATASALRTPKLPILMSH